MTPVDTLPSITLPIGPWPREPQTRTHALSSVGPRYPVWVYLNGHEWAKRQAARQEVEFGALDNGFGACDDAQALADICASLGHEHVLAFCERWMSVLPSPLTAAERRRYAYRYSIRQLELSDTRVFDRPAAGRAWFEQTIRDQPDLGHPDKVQVVFGRKVTRRTPGAS